MDRDNLKSTVKEVISLILTVCITYICLLVFHTYIYQDLWYNYVTEIVVIEKEEDIYHYIVSFIVFYVGNILLDIILTYIFGFL
jgi:hypothetical protein